MSDKTMDDLAELEAEFAREQKGQGSLSPYISGSPSARYVGFDIHPEDIEALFFEGIGVPRWASIEAADLDEQNAIYMERYNEVMAQFPQIGRANDTFEGSAFLAEDIGPMLAECDKIIASTTSPKAVRAAKKFVIAGNKAAAEKAGLELRPRV